MRTACLFLVFISLASGSFAQDPSTISTSVDVVESLRYLASVYPKDPAAIKFLAACEHIVGRPVGLGDVPGDEMQKLILSIESGGSPIAAVYKANTDVARRNIEIDTKMIESLRVSESISVLGNRKVQEYVQRGLLSVGGETVGIAAIHAPAHVLRDVNPDGEFSKLVSFNGKGSPLMAHEKQIGASEARIVLASPDDLQSLLDHLREKLGSEPKLTGKLCIQSNGKVTVGLSVKKYKFDVSAKLDPDARLQDVVLSIGQKGLAKEFRVVFPE